jgi:predicted 3-demethylubiquinone-9 3-methyltransferase (glyoxalase superfamily)
MGRTRVGQKATIQQALFSLNGQLFMCIDSPVKHDFTFTPSMSLFVSCDSEAEVDKLYKALSKGGTELMPLGSYPFARNMAGLWIDSELLGN